MKYIANVITSSKSKKYGSFINVTDKIEGLDLNIPTLFVGYERSKTFCPRLSIINRKIKDNVFWTFAYNEKRYENELDTKDFIKNIKKNIRKKCKYRFFNILTAKRSKIKSFIRYIENTDGKTLYLNDNMAYISSDDTVIGISLSDCEYIGVKKEKVVRRLNEIFNGKIAYKNSFMTEEDKKIFGEDCVTSSILYHYYNS